MQTFSSHCQIQVEKLGENITNAEIIIISTRTSLRVDECGNVGQEFSHLSAVEFFFAGVATNRNVLEPLLKRRIVKRTVENFESLNRKREPLRESLEL